MQSQCLVMLGFSKVMKFPALLKKSFIFVSTSTVNAAENYGDLRKTPLYFAVSNGDVTCSERLLAAGARTDLDPLRCILVAIRAER